MERDKTYRGYASQFYVAGDSANDADGAGRGQRARLSAGGSKR